MRKTTPDLELLRVFDVLRPRDYRVQIVAPDGSITHDQKFGTKQEALTFAADNRGPRDMAMTHYVDSCSKN